MAVLFSGGKDSTYTVWLLQHQSWEIPLLVTVQPSEPDSRVFHYPSIRWTRLQADSLGIEQSFVKMDPGDPDGLGSLEKSLASLKVKFGLDGVATGGVASEYQRTRFDHICDRVGLRSYSPLWHKKPADIVTDLIKADFRVMITGVGARGLDQSWLGKTLDSDGWKRLGQISSEYGIHLTGEGGEYESFVTDAPHFKKAVSVRRTNQTWDGQSGYLTIEEASLVDKPGN